MTDPSISTILRSRRIGEAIPDAVVAADRSGAIVAVNVQAEKLFGYSRGELLVPALHELAAASEAKWKVSCEVRHEDADPVRDPATAIQLYRIAQEAVANAVKHGKPKRVTVRLSSSNGDTTLSVEDDGKGFPENAADGKGMGMHIMRYRAELIGASFDLRKREGGGAVVMCAWKKNG